MTTHEKTNKCIMTTNEKTNEHIQIWQPSNRQMTAYKNECTLNAQKCHHSPPSLFSTNVTVQHCTVTVSYCLKLAWKVGLCFVRKEFLFLSIMHFLMNNYAQSERLANNKTLIETCPPNYSNQSYDCNVATALPNTDLSQKQYCMVSVHIPLL